MVTKGIVFGLISSLFFALMAMTVKMASPYLSSISIVFYRSLIHFIVILFILLIKKESFKFALLKNAWFRSIFGCVSVYVYYKSLGAIPISDATLIIDSSPVFVMIASVLFFKSKISVVQLLSLFVFMSGLFTMVSYENFNSNILDYCFAFIGPVALAFSFIYLKKSISSLSPYQILLSLNATMLIFSISTGWEDIFRGNYNFEVCMIILLSSFLALMAQITLSYSFMYLDQIYASLLTLLSTIWASIIDILVWGNDFTFQRVLMFILFLIGIIMMRYGNETNLTFSKKSE